MNNPYSFLLDSSIRKLLEPGKPIRHRQTCPVCGKKLTNIYLRGDEWKCNECWKAATVTSSQADTP